MTIPRVETFEKDIEEEIQQKETTMADVVASHEDSPSKKKETPFLFLMVSFIVTVIILAVGFAYYLYNRMHLHSKDVVPTEIVLGTPRQQITALSTILPQTGANLDRFINKIQKEDTLGYSITINNYEQVFGYLLHNEATFEQEATTLLGSTSTESLSFADLTLSNQDMRAAITQAGIGVVYGFVGTSTLLLANSPENLLLLRDAILK